MEFMIAFRNMRNGPFVRLGRYDAMSFNQPLLQQPRKSVVKERQGPKSRYYLDEHRACFSAINHVRNACFASLQESR